MSKATKVLGIGTGAALAALFALSACAPRSRPPVAPGSETSTVSVVTTNAAPATTNTLPARAMVPMYPTTTELAALPDYTFTADMTNNFTSVTQPGSGRGNIRIGRDGAGKPALIVPEEALRFTTPQARNKLFDTALHQAVGAYVNDGIDWTEHNKQEIVLALKAIENSSDRPYVHAAIDAALASDAPHDLVIHVNSKHGPRAGQVDWMSTARPPAPDKNGRPQPQPDYTLADLHLVAAPAPAAQQ